MLEELIRNREILYGLFGWIIIFLLINVKYFWSKKSISSEEKLLCQFFEFLFYSIALTIGCMIGIYEIIIEELKNCFKKKKYKKIETTISQTRANSYLDYQCDPSNLSSFRKGCSIKQYDLNLGGRKLREFPMEVLNQPDIKSLNLAGNSIKSLPDEISQLQKLEVLNLKGNHLEYLPDGFCQLKSLKKLNLNRNNLKALPEDFGNLKSLGLLYLIGNDLKDLPQSFSDLDSLLELNLSENQFVYFPESLTKHSGLEHLEMQNNRLIQLTDIPALKRLNYLDLSHNRLESLGRDLSSLKCLWTLRIEHNALLDLPDTFAKSSSIGTFVMDSHLVQSLKKPLKHYTRARFFVVDRRARVSLPDICTEHPFDRWKAEWLLKMGNIEHRMIFIKLLGYEKILKAFKSNLVHRDKDQLGNTMELFYIKMREINKADDIYWFHLDDNICLLKVVCPSTDKIHVLRVPPTMKTCEEARRWTLFDVTGQFDILKET